jgi:hypothetical protein
MVFLILQIKERRKKMKRNFVFILSFVCVAAIGSTLFWATTKSLVKASNFAQQYLTSFGTVTTENASCKNNSLRTAQSDKDKFHERLQKGIGTEVRWASANDSTDGKISDSVESIAGFIFNRSDLSMSQESKKSLIKAEKDTLKGKRHRLSVDKLVDAITSSVINRAASLADSNIEQAAGVYRSTPQGELTTRSSGKWGFVTREEFVSQLKAGREWSGRGDVALRASIRPMIAEEVKERVAELSAALPSQFGSVQSDGLTPLQAVVIAYSVAADDPLSDSPSDLKRMIVKQRMLSKQRKSDNDEQKRGSNKPYGIRGALYSSPVSLVFNKATINELTTQTQGGQNQ